ncbi:MAG: FG-GAP-like repeat-containing protein [Bacteroidetes bacterium]|nr:FG-GAP-like repeat-containing protein [Bacteroidota bacterium]
MRYAIIFLIFLSFALNAQRFIKITEGAIVNDGGDSRSVNWIDHDRDGDLDLFVSNGKNGGQNNFFYQNNGDGTFTKIDSIVITKDNSPSVGASWGDFDNDGYPDLFVSTWYNKINYLYKNNGDGTYTQLSSSAVMTDLTYSETGTWGDYNKDGFLDLYVTNSAGNTRNLLYKNNGNGSFTKQPQTGFLTDQFFSRNADFIEYNGDFLPDLFVVNEGSQNENLYTNLGNGSFSRTGNAPLLNNGGSSISSNYEDVDNDGDMDIFISNAEGGRNWLLLNDGNNNFTKVAEPFNTDVANSFSSVFGDIDNDGDLDLFVSNAFNADNTPMTNYLYINHGNAIFVRDTVTLSEQKGWTYGAAFADYNKDGWLDLFTANCFGANQNNSLYRNSGGSNNWIMIDLEGIRSNRSGIGAVVKLKVTEHGTPRWMTRRVSAQSGHCSQNMQLHFGLGTATTIDSVVIMWSSGIVQFVNGLLPGSFNRIVEDTTLTGINPETDYSNIHGFNLMQNYPNPFNPETRISFTTSNAGTVTLKVYDILGNIVKELINEYRHAGQHSVTLNAEGLSSGIYLYELTSNGNRSVKKLSVLK